MPSTPPPPRTSPAADPTADHRRRSRRARRGALAGVALAGTVLVACSTDASAPPATTAPPPAAPSGTAAASTPDEEVPSRPPGTMATPAGTLARGWNVAVPANEDLARRDQLDLLGRQVVMAFDGTAAPVVAYTELIDSGGGNYALLVTRWSPDEGAWSAPEEIARGPLAERASGRTISMAADPSTGLVALALENQIDGGNATSGIDLMFSTDGAQTWRRTAVTDEEGASHPSLVAHGGRVDVAWLSDREGLVVSTGATVAEGMTWRRRNAPTGGRVVTRVAPSVAVAPDGTVGVAFVVAPTVGPDQTVAFWTVDGAGIEDVMGSGGAGDDAPGVALTFDGDQPVVAASLRRAGSPDPVWVSTRSPEGFGPPEALPADGVERADGVAIAPPDEGGATVVFTPVDEDATGSCGLPKVAAELEPAEAPRWVTCGPPADDEVVPNSLPVVVRGPDGGAYVPVANRNPDGPQPAGILVWVGGADLGRTEG